MSPLFSWVRSVAREMLGKERLRRQHTALDDAEFVVLDTELTGLNPRKDAVVSVGAMRMRGSRIELGSRYYRVVKPDRPLGRDSVVVHGITPEETDAQPPLGDVLWELYEYCGNAILAGHFILFDRRVLNREMRRNFGRVFDNPVIDTWRLHHWLEQNKGDFSRHYQGRAEKLDLFSLARQYGVPVSGAHNALGDAFITAQLLQRFLRLLPATGVRTIGELLRVGAP